MNRIRCIYCHEEVDEATYPAHEAAHLATRADGQQVDYATLPPEQREQGKLEGVPCVYIHQACGEATEMPEDIIRSYLKNPYLYDADTTFCCGCGKQVPLRKCRWVETGEDLQTYTNTLRRAVPELKPRGGCLAGLTLAFGTAGACLGLFL